MDNMKGFGMMIQELKKNPKTIVFTEGTDERILEARSEERRVGKECRL